MESISTIQAAEKFGCSETTVSRLIDDGGLGAYRIRGTIRIFTQSVEEYLVDQMSIPANDLQLQKQVTEERRKRISERQENRAPKTLTPLPHSGRPALRRASVKAAVYS